MQRRIFRELKNWKDDPRRKPLLIRGARQVGKTFIIRELGELFQDFIEINFELQPKVKKIFDRDLDPHRIVQNTRDGGSKRQSMPFVLIKQSAAENPLQ